MDVIGSAPEASPLTADEATGECPRPGRRRVRLAAALTVVALLVTWAALDHRGNSRGTSAATSRTDAPSAVPAALGEPRADQPVDQVVVDWPYLYALVALCSRPSGCRETLAASDDAGMSWHKYALPDARPPHDGQLTVLGPSTLLLVNSRGRWISHDRALHWQRARAAERGAIAESVPVGGQPTLTCASATIGARLCDVFQVSATFPEDGADTPLRHQPGVSHPVIASAPAGDGSLWIKGTDRAGHPAVSVSTDRGRSWITTTLPFSSDRILNVTVLTRGGPLGYALATAVDMHSRSLIALDGIARTADGGRTWELIHSADHSRPETARAAALVDGDRLVTSVEPPEVGVYLSRDGGRSFAAMTGAPWGLSWFEDAGPWLLATGGGYLWRLDGDSSWHLLRPEL